MITIFLILAPTKLLYLKHLCAESISRNFYYHLIPGGFSLITGIALVLMYLLGNPGTFQALAPIYLFIWVIGGFNLQNLIYTGPALIGIELEKSSDLGGLIQRMDERKITYEYINDKPDYFQFLI